MFIFIIPKKPLKVFHNLSVPSPGSAVPLIFNFNPSYFLVFGLHLTDEVSDALQLFDEMPGFATCTWYLSQSDSEVCMYASLLIYVIYLL
ncbi:hypothetical protein Hanom_Chr09g00764451 [Helianthus anomalus]